MNPIVIVLGIIVIVLIYFLYTLYVSKTSSIVQLVNLNNQNPSINYNSLVNANSTRYAYGTWIYINTWDNTKQKTIISRGNDFKLYLDTLTPTLKCNIKNTSDTNFNSSNDIIITSNFPIQKWTYVIISIDNQIVDCYLDGKLVKSTQLSYVPAISQQNISMGDSNNPDIFLAMLNRWATPIDPQTAWNYYLQGNGMGSINMNVKLSLYQDNVEQKSFSLY